MKLPCSHSSDYYFISSEEPLLQNLSFDPFLFNEAKFLLNSAGNKRKYFYIINKDRNLIIGRMNVAVAENSGYSPYKAPFGGIEFEDGLKPDVLREFLHFIEQDCENYDIALLNLKLYPEVYSKENTAILVNALISSGYKLQFAEVNQHIEVNDEPYINRVNYAEKKRIKKCIKAGFKFDLLEIDELAQGYNLIKETRDRKGYPTSMTFQELENIMLKFPENYLFFSVKDGENIIALSISILINNKILYNFYHAHDEDYDTYSPIVLVVQGVYDYCQSHNIKILDLGISTDRNILNEGLYRFKKNLGAETSLKYSFKKDLKY